MSSFHLNVPRVLGDVSHTASKLVLIWAIHSNKSAEGVSLLTQLLYILVFVTRYLDLFWVPPGWSIWNFVLKIFYITSSAYIVFLMMRVYARTREREYGWKLAIYCLSGSAILAAPVCILFEGWKASKVSEVFWTFSIILESVCVLPQLLLLRQTTVPTVLDSYYLVLLGSYRFFYILNWIVKGVGDPDWYDPTSVIFGILQTALYLDFAWVYYTRQRVKLRGGGIVDSDDLSKSFLVRRFVGRPRNNNNGEGDDDIADEDEALAGQENGVIRPSGNRWGSRGISVSADDTLQEHFDDSARDAQPRFQDPSEFEDLDDDDVDAPPPPAKNTTNDSNTKASTGNKANDADAGNKTDQTSPTTSSQQVWADGAENENGKAT